MKILCYNDFGRWFIPIEMAENPNYTEKDYILDFENQFDKEDFYPDEDRTNQNVINWILNHPKKNTGIYVVEIPDNATDYKIIEEGSYESIYAVVDGKIIECE